MGLLNQDQWGALGLLGAGLMKGRPADGFMMANQYLDEAPLKQAKLGLLQAQMAEAQEQAADRQRARALQQQIEQAARANMVSPSLANAASMGPMPDGSPVPQVQPGFNQKGFLQQLYAINPLKALEMERAMAKDNKPLTVAPGASLVDPTTMKPVFTAPKEQELPSAVREYQFAQQQGYKGTFEQWDTARKRASGTNVNIGVNTDKSYFGNVAEGLAKNDVAAIEAARSAPERVTTSQRVRDILKQSPITGTGAEARLALNKALATAGVIDGKNVADTEVLASTLASQALDAIKSSGLGGGNGFSNADRDFLERARAGKIDMNSQSLARIADLNERAARETIKRGNAVIGKLRMSPQAGQMGSMLEPVPEPAVPSVVLRPPGGAASAPARAPSIDDLLKKYGQ